MSTYRYTSRVYDNGYCFCRELEAELVKHEALLNKMHEEMQQSQPVSSTYGTTTPTNVDKEKEEQLWAQQRLVTALKRKVLNRFYSSRILLQDFFNRLNKKHVVYNKIVSHHFLNIQDQRLLVHHYLKQVKIHLK